MSLTVILQKKLTNFFGTTGEVRLHTIGGGSINDTYHVLFNREPLFCKVNSATKFPHLFLSEKRGLQLLARQNIVNTPTVIDHFEADGYQFLLLQWVPEGERTERFWKKFGEQLAALHRVSHPHHGLNETNYMGSVPQQNTPNQLWCEFFAAERLSPLIKRCTEKGQLTKTQVVMFEKLQKKLSSIFEEEPPSLLHGDLWSGNFMCDADSEPVLIDPAVYFGHRSVDLAMTTLFGGFQKPFYEAYHFHFPLPANHPEQWAVCNLYPLLIHLYLFGRGYLPQIERTLKQFA